MTDPTRVNYIDLSDAFDYLNKALFSGRLPHCLITFQRHKNALGYFSPQRFTSRDESTHVDEIALNPETFRRRTDQDILSTLAHEMVHLQQQHFGNPGRTGYHNAEWAGMMDAIGLVPSNTGQPGGKRTGQKMTHYIDPAGAFAAAYAELAARGVAIRYMDAVPDDEQRKKKAASKTKFTCPTCEANAWAKPDSKLVCGECDEPMLVEDKDDD